MFGIYGFYPGIGRIIHPRIFEVFFMAFLCVSQQGEFKNTTKGFWGKSMSKALYPKKSKDKIEGGGEFCRFFLRFFLSRFSA
jgi:hypothetical protein